jgi:hypothetical protein
MLVAGDPNYYRVTTGVASGSAGNIIIPSPGLLQAIPAVGTAISVDMTDDKVVIAKTGTATTRSTDATGYAPGATTIAIQAGTGTIVVGESIQFAGDPNFYAVTTGVTSSAGNLVIAAPGLVVAIPAVATTLNNRGHAVTLAGIHVWGDDTTSTTLASNGIALSGALVASRTTSSKLTCRGTLMMGDNSCVDLGSTGSPITTGTTCTIVVNDSATPVTSKHGFVALNTTLNPVFRAVGATRTANTTLTAGTGAGATSITVAAATGWEIGDRLVIASDTTNPSRTQVVTITGGSGLTWSVTAITNARVSGIQVGNLTSNVKIMSYSTTTPACGVVIQASTSSVYGEVDVADLWVQDAGTAWSGSGALYAIGAFSIGVAPLTNVVIRRVKVDSTASTTITCGFTYSGAHPTNKPAITDAVYYGFSSSGFGIRSNVSSGSFDGCIYSSSTAVGLASAIVVDMDFTGYFIGASEAVAYEAPQLLVFNNATIISSLKAFSAGNGLLTMFGGSVQSSTRLIEYRNLGTYSSLRSYDTTFDSTCLTSTLAFGTAVPSNRVAATLIRVAGTATDNRVRSYTFEALDDDSTRNRGTASVKIAPTIVSTPALYLFTIPVTAGVSQIIKGYLRFDATYGTATPPIVAMTGQGASFTYTATATANLWDPFSYTFTPTGTGDVTVTMTIQSTSISGFAWLDGVYHYPMIQYTRHYGYFPAIKATLTIDPVVQLSEAAAGALAGISYAAGTLTISGTRTLREVYDWMQWYECTNILTPIITSGDGVSITLACNLTISGALTGSGSISMPAYTLSCSGTSTVPITHSAGTLVPIVVSGLVTGSRIQVYDVTSSTELYNDIPGTSLLLNKNWTVDHTLRLRVAYQSTVTAKLPVEALGLLSSVGSTFLVSQIADTVYNTLAIDGSTCTEFIADYPNLQIDVSDPDHTTTVQRVYAWSTWAQTTVQGIALMFKAVVATDELNFTIDVGVVNAQLDNITGVPVIIAGGYLYRSDGTTVIAPTSGSIQMDPSRAYMVSTATTRLTEIAALHGLIIGQPLLITNIQRATGTIVQTIADTGTVITVNRTS